MHRHMHSNPPPPTHHTNMPAYAHKHPSTQAAQGTRTEEIFSKKRMALKKDLKKLTIYMMNKFFWEHADRVFATRCAWWTSFFESTLTECLLHSCNTLASPAAEAGLPVWTVSAGGIHSPPLSFWVGVATGRESCKTKGKHNNNNKDF